VYAQANAVQNGVYTVTNPGNATAQWVLTRATDADTFGLANPNSLGAGDAFFVQDGDTGAGRTYVCNTQGTITFGSTNITFAQISSAQIYAAGTGLNLSNLTFSVANTTVVSGLYGDSANVSVIEVNAQGQLTSASNSAINVSSITVGTLPNARTTADSANGASTIVSRDANGSFAANVVTATTGSFTNITGNAIALTAINASNVTSGTLDNARTTGNTANSASTIVLRDATGNFGANTISGAFSGDGSAINAINASNISAGTIANARTTASSSNGAATIVLRDSSGSFLAGVITADGSGLSNINASNISSGTVATARLASGTANSSTYLRGDSTWAALSAPNNGTLTMNTSGTGLSGSQTFTADQASNVTFTVASNANSANGASTIVARDSNGSFTANVGTFTTVGGTLSTAAQTNITSTGNLTNLVATSFGCGTAASGTAGEIRATNNITAFYSDERLKTKTGDIENALDKICQIETMLYHANEIAVTLGYDASIQEVGVTAQSVQKVQPEVVVPAPIDDKYLTVRYEKLVPLLIEAIKELKAEVDALKGK
jgi:hypothetical protein